MAKNKIIWAINPFQANSAVFKKTVRLLQVLGRGGDSQIMPVFVVSPAEANVVLEFSVPAKNRFRIVAEQACRRVLRGIRIRGMSPPKVLVENHLAISFSAKTLASYAAKVKADEIVLGTHGREGIPRFLLGSFAETLLFIAKTPVILVNPRVSRVAPIRRILFASDFSPESFKAFRRLCATAKGHRAEILLYHVLPKPFQWAQQGAEFLFGRGLMGISEYLAIEAENRGRDAQPFTRLAKARKIPLRLQIEKTGKEISQAVLDAAKKFKIDLLALATHSGQFKTFLLGSTARGVLREAPIPVWILRPR
jgi:nucleotide-binding universal stress UspA family protein